MSEMVKRVAMALADDHGLVFDNLREDECFDDDFDYCKPTWIRRAVTAIFAMREPTEKVGDAGNRAMSLYGAHDCEVPPVEIFNAMIDEALK